MPISKDPAKKKKQLANLEKGKFKKGKVTKPKGRPRSTIRTMIADFEKQGLIVPTNEEIGKMYMYIASLNEKELGDLLQNKDLPMMTRIIAKGILSKKGLDVIDRIVNRTYGSQQHIDITTNGKDMKPEPLTIRFIASKEELEKLQDEVPDLPLDIK